MKAIDENYFYRDDNNAKTKIEDFLAPDEKILYRGRPKKGAYVVEKSIILAPIAIFWFLIDIGIITFIISTFIQESPFLLLVIIPFFLLHLAPVWVWIFIVIKSASKINREKYYITNKRVIVLNGKTPYIDSEINLCDITSTIVKRSPTDKIAKVGDLYISSNEKKACFFDMKDYDFLDSRIKSIIDNNLEEALFDEYANLCPYCGASYNKNELICPGCGSRVQK